MQPGRSKASGSRPAQIGTARVMLAELGMGEDEVTVYFRCVVYSDIMKTRKIFNYALRNT
jgi:hypothetical protein